MDTGKNLKVLVVDDAYFMRELIIKELKEFGCEVIGEAKNGLEAIRMYKKYKPDLVTMDIKMPEMNGIETIKEIKRINPQAKIIVITGVYDSKKEALKAGADDFLKKPFQPAFLWKKIDKIIENSKKEIKIDEGVGEKAEEIKKVELKNKENQTESIVIEGKYEDDDLLGGFNPVSNENTDNNMVFDLDSKSDDEDIFKVENDDEEFINIKEHYNSYHYLDNEGGDFEEDNETIKISIRPPRNVKYNKRNYMIDFNKDKKQIEPPIINYVEKTEEEELSFLKKIKKHLFDLLKIN